MQRCTYLTPHTPTSNTHAEKHSHHTETLRALHSHCCYPSYPYLYFYLSDIKSLKGFQCSAVDLFSCILQCRNSTTIFRHQIMRGKKQTNKKTQVCWLNQCLCGQHVPRRHLGIATVFILTSILSSLPAY